MIATIHQRVITVEIKRAQNASEASDGCVFKAFYNVRHVASSERSIDDQTIVT